MTPSFETNYENYNKLKSKLQNANSGLHAHIDSS